MTAADEARAEATEAAWRAYLAEHGCTTVPTSPDTGADFSFGFTCGWDARDAEVERLTAQLQAAQAVIADAQTALAYDKERGYLERIYTTQNALSRTDLSTLAEHDKQVAAKALTDAADDAQESVYLNEAGLMDATRAVGAQEVTVHSWLSARAASIEQTEGE